MSRHGPVRLVANPAGKTKACRLAPNPVSEADTLHRAVDARPHFHEMTSHESLSVCVLGIWRAAD